MRLPLSLLLPTLAVGLLIVGCDTATEPCSGPDCAVADGSKVGDAAEADAGALLDAGIDTGIADEGAPDPGPADEGAADPGPADEGAPDPGPADEGAADPGLADPGATDPGPADEGAPDPGAADPGGADPGPGDPGVADPGPADVGTAWPVLVAPAQVADWVATSWAMTLVDVREPAEVAAGKIPGALEMPWISGALEAQWATLPTDRPVVVYCASGGRSAAASAFLVEQGLAPVYDMEGGFNAYAAGGFPVQ